jgi:hypothetical protein
MAKAKKTSKKKRAKQYDPKLKINGSFEDVIKLSVTHQKEDGKKSKAAKKSA